MPEVFDSATHRRYWETVYRIQTSLRERPDLATLSYAHALDWLWALDRTSDELLYIAGNPRFLPRLQRAAAQTQESVQEEWQRATDYIRQCEYQLRVLTKPARPAKPPKPAKKKQPPPPKPAARPKPVQRVVRAPTWFRENPNYVPAAALLAAKQREQEQEPPLDDATHVPWVVLGAKIRSVPELRSYLKIHYERRKRHKELEYDWERITFLLQYNPKPVYIGRNDFDGYLVFVFVEYRTAVFECPKIGNALYIIRGEWQTLARKSKTALLHDTSGKVQRIVHHGEWTEQLRLALLDS